MRRAGWITRVAVLAGVAAACLPAVPAAGAPQGRALPSRMLVYAQEWSLWPSRSSVPAGKLTVQLWNRGMDAHDLRIRWLNQSGAMIGSVQDVAVTQSGQLHQSTWRLGAGTYELYCSMPGHAARGMRVRIRVR
jgi:hypothetical protein